jgi:hypothetical protein
VEDSLMTTFALELVVSEVTTDVSAERDETQHADTLRPVASQPVPSEATDRTPPAADQSAPEPRRIWI